MVCEILLLALTGRFQSQPATVSPYVPVWNPVSVIGLGITLWFYSESEEHMSGLEEADIWEKNKDNQRSVCKYCVQMCKCPDGMNFWGESFLILRWLISWSSTQNCEIRSSRENKVTRKERRRLTRTLEPMKDLLADCGMISPSHLLWSQPASPQAHCSLTY